MIDHADTALERWLGATIDPATIDFVDAPEPDGDPAAGGSSRPHARDRTRGVSAAVTLLALAEKVERRDREIADVRDDTGRVTARQRSLRWFELDYRIALSGDTREAHRLLGALVQALVDDDVVAPEHLPDELVDLGVPVEISLRPGSVAGHGGAGVVVTLVVPARPRADAEIAEPVRELDLEMSPPPGAVARAPLQSTDDELLLTDRRWTTVRRRERISPQRSLVDEAAPRRTR